MGRPEGRGHPAGSWRTDGSRRRHGLPLAPFGACRCWGTASGERALSAPTPNSWSWRPARNECNRSMGREKLMPELLLLANARLMRLFSRPQPRRYVVPDFHPVPQAAGVDDGRADPRTGEVENAGADRRTNRIHPPKLSKLQDRLRALRTVIDHRAGVRRGPGEDPSHSLILQAWGARLTIWSIPSKWCLRSGTITGVSGPSRFRDAWISTKPISVNTVSS